MMSSLNNKKCNTVQKLKHVAEAGNAFSKWDWLLFVVLAGFCYVSFCHSDICVTGNRAWQLWNSNFFDYYDVLHAFSENYGANYLFSTFFLFAIWILPLKLLGFSEPAYRTSRGIFNLWYQLLPLLFYVASAYLIYRIAMQIGMKKHRAKLCMYSFLTMPIAFFSQFIFSQYDIFTVFFMLLGISYYFKAPDEKLLTKEMVLFSLFFGIATTFKYFALLIFLVFLLVREKKLLKTLPLIAIAVAPFILECLPFMGSDGFRKGVFGFFVLDYTAEGNIVTRIGSVSLMKALCVFCVIWAYFVTPKDKDDRVRWLLYLCCGMCFAIFGFMTWHPQWLLFAVPFWVLSAFVSKHTEKYYWGNILLCVVFYLFVFQAWPGGVDETLLRNGIWKRWLEAYPFIKHTADLIPKIDRDTLYSVIFAILMALFVFAHPKYTRDDLSAPDENDHMWLVRCQVLLAVILFAVPTFYTAIYAVNNTYVQVGEGSTLSLTPITSDQVIEQEIDGVDGELTHIDLFTATYDRMNSAEVSVEIVDCGTNTVISKSELDTGKVKNCDYTEVDLPNVYLEEGKAYRIRIGSTDGVADNCCAVGYCADNGDGYQGILNGERAGIDYQMLLRFSGR